MSFLAQLRQQQTPVAGHKRQLCYLLQLDRPPVRLSLTLAEPRNHRLDKPGQPYTVQQPHLQTPPPFFGDGDSALLQTLITADTSWLEHSQGLLPISQSGSLLRQILASGRCFGQRPSGQWQVIREAPQLPAELYWQIGSGGEQWLDWNTSGNGALFHADSWAAPLLYCSADASISQCRHRYTETALQQALPYFQPQPPEVITGLLTQQEQWSKLGLPLPRQLTEREQSAELTPILRLSSDATSDRVQLQFRYSNEH